MKYGSYENVSLLKKTYRVFDINAQDNDGKPPIYYAHLQGSGKMYKALRLLGAID